MIAKQNANEASLVLGQETYFAETLLVAQFLNNVATLPSATSA